MRVRDYDGAGHLSWLKGGLDMIGGGTERMGAGEWTVGIKVQEGVSWKDGWLVFTEWDVWFEIRGEGAAISYGRDSGYNLGSG